MTYKMCSHCNVEMKSQVIKGIEVEYCESCGGICLQKGELDKVTDKTAGSVEFSTITDQQLENVDSKKVIACPKCRTPNMRKVEFLSVTDIILDRCDHCGAIWLDKSELEQINTRIAELDDSVNLPLWGHIQIIAIALGVI